MICKLIFYVGFHYLVLLLPLINLKYFRFDDLITIENKIRANENNAH